jgi:transcriptional antiterminator NusG
MAMKCYVIHTTPNYENKVRDRILARAEQHGLTAAFGEIFVPSEEIAEVKNGKKVVVTRRLYPGYIFANMELNDQVWHLIKKIPNITGFVGGARPTPMKQSEVDDILNRQAESRDKPAPKVMFKEGEVVRVNSGPFNDFNGTVNGVDYDKAKLRVMITVFGRDTPVEIAFSDVEKVS